MQPSLENKLLINQRDCMGHTPYSDSILLNFSNGIKEKEKPRHWALNLRKSFKINRYFVIKIVCIFPDKNSQVYVFIYFY